MEQSSYYIGATGHGKSTLMEQNIIANIHAGHGVMVIDPHGDLVDTILKHIPKTRHNDVVLFAPAQFCMAFNPLYQSADFDVTTDALLYAFKDIYKYYSISTATFDDYISHSVKAMLHVPDGTLLGIRYLITNPKYREHVLSYVTDPYIKDFWIDYGRMAPKDQRQETSSTRNKASAILADARIRRTIGQYKSSFIMSDILKDKILLCCLDQGKLGIEKTRLLGMLLLAQLHTAALGRTTRTPFHVYIDEMHHFQGAAMREMLSGARKFGITLHLAHQYLDQLTKETRSAIIGNITDRYVFNVGREDTERLSIEDGTSGTNLPYYELPRYVANCNGDEIKVLPTPPGDEAYAQKLCRLSARHYGRTPAKADKEIDHQIRRHLG